MGIYTDLPLQPTEKTIRLIKLRPAGDRSAPLAAELVVASLDTNPQYAALSYCWGSTTLSCRIDCNDYVLDITKNLGLALSSIRSTSRLSLWVDQICINQADSVERSAQVACMKQIYSQATETFVYLGEPDLDTEETACKVLETFYNPVLKDLLIYDDYKLLRLRACLSATKLAVQHPSLAKRAFDKDVRRAIFWLTTRPYFTRKWVVQELLKSPSLSCLVGSHRIVWNALIQAAWWTFNNSCDDNEEWAHYPDMDWLFSMKLCDGSHERSPLLTLMYFSRFFHATDPRDHIYALLGIASDSDDFPEPDYRKTLEQVYKETASCFVQQGNGFLMLHLAGIRPIDNRMPSWVVDWRDLDRFYCSKYFASFCSGGADGYIKLGTDAATIRVLAKVVDRVGAAGQPFRGEMNHSDRLTQYIEDCTCEFEKFYEKGTGKLNIQRDLASMISFDMKYDNQFKELWVFDQDHHSDIRHADLSIYYTQKQQALIYARYLSIKLDRWLSRTGDRIGVSDLSRLCRSIKPVETPRILAEDGVINGFKNCSWDETVRRLNFFLPTTRPIMTHNRRLGFAPVLTQKDDVVCVIAGAKAPFILRPSGDGAYKIVGEAYVRDIMFGETLTDDRYPLEEILIR